MRKKKKTESPIEKVYATGFKGFGPGMVCRGKQYAENTVFEEKTAEICESGMHFCKNPLDVLNYYPLLDNDGRQNEFAEVEALAPVETEASKSVTTKMKVGKKLSLGELIGEAVKFLLGKGTAECVQAASGDYSQLAASGNDSQLAASGRHSQLAASGDGSIAVAVGKYSYIRAGKNAVAASMGECGRVKGALGASLVCAEWASQTLVCVKSVKVDGKKIKADTWYTVKDGNFVEVER